MSYVSTAGTSPPVDLRQALFQSLAPDGGLYWPERLPRLPGPWLEALPGQPLAATAATVATALLDSLPAEPLSSLVAKALNFPIPLVALGEETYLLELFQGPTLAFKDVGARFMARLCAILRRPEDPPLTVLAATSGDTGSAVAQAFLGVAGTRVAVLYPEGKVTAVQECQFTTLGDNVQALAVAGTFDDCQRLVKAAFADQDLARELSLTSANSINLGRLLPQSFYYFHAVAQLPGGARSKGPPIFVVPSGNFGNLTAGLAAQEMGLPVAGFVAATNANDIVPQYLARGLYRPRPSVATLSNAMDVGDPSNFVRILHLCGGSLEAVRRRIRGVAVSDEETREVIARVYRERGTVLDPHTAVGYRALEKLRREESLEGPAILLATAHPVKFRETVEPLLGRSIPVPERLRQSLELPRRSLPLAPREEALKDFLRSW